MLSETRSPHSLAAPDLVGRETQQKPSDQQYDCVSMRLSLSAPRCVLLPSPRAAVGRGRGWGVAPRVPMLMLSTLKHPPPPTPPHHAARARGRRGETGARCGTSGKSLAQLLARMCDWPARSRQSMRDCRQNGLRQKTNFASRLKRITGSSPLSKIFLLSFFQKLVFLDAVPPRYEGRFAVVTDVEAGCGGRVDVAAWLSRRRTAPMRTVKSRGPDTPTLVSSSRRRSGVAQVTVAKKPGAPGRTRSSRQNHRAGNAGMSRLNLW